MIGLLKRLAGAERGATAVEYGLICALIVLAAMGAITGFSTKVIGMWDDVSNEVLNESS
jgi:pilus assembly protein Flp/PilA